MKVSEMAKLLKKNGFQIKRHGAEHDIWYNPKTQKETALPRHQSKELPTGTANKILKDMGLK